jgi:branched-subunit amino acid transport protein
MIMPRMMKFAASKGVGAIMVQEILMNTCQEWPKQKGDVLLTGLRRAY